MAPGFGGINLEEIPPALLRDEDLASELESSSTTTRPARRRRDAALHAPRSRKRSKTCRWRWGLGAAGIAVKRMLCRSAGAEIIGCDTNGALRRRAARERAPAERWAGETNRTRPGAPAEVLKARPVHRPVRTRVGRPRTRPLTKTRWFPMANHQPRGMPEEPRARGIIATA